jgi:hypothetical protein
MMILDAEKIQGVARLLERGYLNDCKTSASKAESKMLVVPLVFLYSAFDDIQEIAILSVAFRYSRTSTWLVEAGANVVFRHSGHFFRGIEIYRHTPILYCTGDFIDDYAIDPVERNDESFVFPLEGKDDKVDRMELYPTKIEMFQANIARGPEI